MQLVQPESVSCSKVVGRYLALGEDHNEMHSLHGPLPATPAALTSDLSRLNLLQLVIKVCVSPLGYHGLQREESMCISYFALGNEGHQTVCSLLDCGHASVVIPEY